MQEEKPLRFFGRRKGKAIRPFRMELLEHLLPKIALTFPIKFGIQPKETWLEIGFGGGEHLAALALENKDVGFIGAEPFINGVALLLAHLNGSTKKPALNYNLEEKRVDNVRIFNGDVRLLFPKMKENTFDRIFLLYPDPWPKERHKERRFIGTQENIKALYRLLKENGKLYIATDMEFYAVFANQELKNSGLFQEIWQNPHKPFADWVPTRYEEKALKAGRKPYYYIFSKKK